ncbi:MAG: hypothetical protein KJO50_08385, partial [Bacteroidia bacterium]|nr:hypothetical protein [Bacteroidia bacterium]
SSELMFSFSMNSGETNSALGQGSLSTEHRNILNLENLGAVFHSRVNGSDLMTSNFAIGLQQFNNFSQEFGFSGKTKGTIVERFLELANGVDPDGLDPFEAGLAYETGAIFDDGSDLLYESDIDSVDLVLKKQNVSRSGQINELVMAWGGKFKNGLAIGLGIGVPFISFEEDKIYQEEDDDGSLLLFNDLTYSERLTTSGTGFNFKLGMNYTIERMIRLGLAYQSPTWFRMDDNYYTSMNYDCEVCTRSNESIGSPDGYFRYKLKTPERLTGSVGALIKTSDIKAFLNLDIQYVNYTSNAFNFSDFSGDLSEIDYEREVNGDIDDQLQSTYNFNVGGELAIDKFRIRSGVSFIGSPYYVDGSSEYDKIYALGFGVRADRAFIDFSYQYRDYSEGYIPYRILDAERQPLVKNSSNFSKFAVTVGFKI